jgi:hypothetical protein
LSRRWVLVVEGTACPAAMSGTCDNKNSHRSRASVGLRESFDLQNKKKKKVSSHERIQMMRSIFSRIHSIIQCKSRLL